MGYKPKNIENYPETFFMENDRYNQKLWKKGLIRQWFPPVSDPSFLWLHFIGKSSWNKGFWIHHPRTVYLDFQVVEEGEMILHYGGQRYGIPAGSAVLIPPGESRLSTCSPGGCRKIFLGISGLILNDNLAGMNLDQVCVLHDFRNPEFFRLFAELWKMTGEKSMDNLLEYCARIYQMLLLISHCATEHPYPEELLRALAHIGQNFSSPLTLKELCRCANCGRTTLQWQFKHYLKSSPTQYLTDTRMNHAVRLLENTPLSIKEIAQKSGYEDPLYFSTIFRKKYGCSPRAFRKNVPLIR